MGKLDKLKSQIPQGSQELSTKNHLAKTEIAMSFQNEGTELTRILLRNIEFNPHNLWSCNDDDESIQQLADAIERNGLLHNIVVSQREDGTFMLLSGERRVKALRLLQKREQESDPTGQKAHKWDRVQAQTYTGLDELSELIILDEANIMVRGLSGDAKTIQACISRYLDNLQAKFQVDRRAAEAYFKSRTQMTDSTVQRYTQFDKSLIDDVKEFFQNGTISHAQALSLCPLEPSEQVLYVNAINKAIQMSNGDKALEHTYVTRITDRAAQAARMTNGRHRAARGGCVSDGERTQYLAGGEPSRLKYLGGSSALLSQLSEGSRGADAGILCGQRARRLCEAFLPGGEGEVPAAGGQ